MRRRFSGEKVAAFLFLNFPDFLSTTQASAKVAHTDWTYCNPKLQLIAWWFDVLVKGLGKVTQKRETTHFLTASSSTYPHYTFNFLWVTLSGKDSSANNDWFIQTSSDTGSVSLKHFSNRKSLLPPPPKKRERQPAAWPCLTSPVPLALLLLLDLPGEMLVGLGLLVLLQLSHVALLISLRFVQISLRREGGTRSKVHASVSKVLVFIISRK